MPLDKLFVLGLKEKQLIKTILSSPTTAILLNQCDQLVDCLIGHQLYLDQTFRAQLNFILERKGVVKIGELFQTFGISKVTLRKHFLDKMGIAPKQVSRIWRLNHFLELQKQYPQDSLTQLAVGAGYYDQAHFIREFKYFFNQRPLSYFREGSRLLAISQDIISRRFSNQYDPRT